MSPDDQDRRILRLERDAEEALHVGRRAHEAAIGQSIQILGIIQDIEGIRGENKETRMAYRTLVLVLVGFAFTVAGSAVGLALTLGGPS